MQRFILERCLSCLLTSFILVTTLPLSKAHADIYIYIDDKGNQHFSERRVNGKYKLLLRSETNQAPATFKNWKEKSYTNITLPHDRTLQYKYHPLIIKAANKYQIEPELIHAVITAESSYRYKATSTAGAQGLMQLMPVTAGRFGVDDPFNPKQNINAGTLYLKILLNEFKTMELALAAYNAGEGTVRRYNNQIPPYPETQQYVKKVIKFYWHYKDNL